MKYRNWSLTVKLVAMMLPAVLCLIALYLIAVDRFHSMMDDAQTSLYDEVYESSSLALNADRDFYQAVYAEKELIIGQATLTEEQREALVADYYDNADQVRDRFEQAINILRDNTVAFEDIKHPSTGRNIKTIEPEFEAFFDEWLKSYAVETLEGDMAKHDASFSECREIINEYSEILEEYAVYSSERLIERINAFSNIAGVAVCGLVLIVVLIAFFTISHLRKTIFYLTNINLQIAEGNFGVTIDEKYVTKAELGQLCIATQQILDRLNNYVDYINEITEVLDTMASGDMRIQLTKDYHGEFSPIKRALLNISDSLNHTIRLIYESSEQVNSGSEQISLSSQSLSEGATRQATAIDNLSTTMRELEAQVDSNNDNSQQANTFSHESGEEVKLGNEHMNEMLKAMNDISSSSEEISKIIKVIEDIAFQTNILALNASVEAARAGEAGKGFAVVADEVRNLANKSADAATQTTSLINMSVKSVADGRVTADNVDGALKRIEEKTLASQKLVEEISRGSAAQLMAIREIAYVVEDISSVVQTNAATAEECSAASEELTAQANSLNDEIAKFKLS